MRMILIAAVLLAAAPAIAQERGYCPGRPGLGTDACIIAPGKLSIETELASWERDDSAGQRVETVALGDTQLRLGVSNRFELDLSWTPYAARRTRDLATGAAMTERGVGDVTLGFKWNFAEPDGSGLSYGSAGFVTVPTGTGPLKTGDWGAGFLLPVTYDLNDAINLQLTPEIDAAPDEDGSGRHLAYSAILGVAIAVSDQVTTIVEVQAIRDEDPVGHTTQALATIALAWMPSERLQLDVGAIAGLNRSSPDIALYVGVARRF